MPEDNPFPLTQAQLSADLRALGLSSGQCVLVHSSLRRIAGPGGWIIGGAEAVILALEEVLTPDGTLVMPTHSSDLSEPAYWVAPPVPATWWPSVRAHMPAFRPDLTTTRGMGRIPETFRRQAGVRRSNHPQHSFAAWGRHADFITAGHALSPSLGEASPLARLYDLDGWILLLGVGHDRNTSLHLAEARADWPGKTSEPQGAPIERDGRREWVTFDNLSLDESDFPQLGAAYAAAGGRVVQALVGQAQTLWMPQRPLIDFAVTWMTANRR